MLRITPAEMSASIHRLGSAIESALSGVKQSVARLFRSCASLVRPAAPDLGGKAASVVAARPQPSVGGPRQDGLAAALFARTDSPPDASAHDAVRMHGAGADGKASTLTANSRAAAQTDDVTIPNPRAENRDDPKQLAAAFGQRYGALVECDSDYAGAGAFLRDNGNDSLKDVEAFIARRAQSFIKEFVDQGLGSVGTARVETADYVARAAAFDKLANWLETWNPVHGLGATGVLIHDCGDAVKAAVDKRSSEVPHSRAHYGDLSATAATRVAVNSLVLRNVCSAAAKLPGALLFSKTVRSACDPLPLAPLQDAKGQLRSDPGIEEMIKSHARAQLAMETLLVRLLALPLGDSRETKASAPG
jgi:hypothetical protein